MAKKAASQHSEIVQRQEYARRDVKVPGRAAVAVLLDRAFEALLGSTVPVDEGLSFSL
jgi:hypothetical protein